MNQKWFNLKRKCRSQAKIFFFQSDEHKKEYYESNWKWKYSKLLVLLERKKNTAKFIFFNKFNFYTKKTRNIFNKPYRIASSSICNVKVRNQNAVKNLK